MSQQNDFLLRNLISQHIVSDQQSKKLESQVIASENAGKPPPKTPINSALSHLYSADPSGKPLPKFNYDQALMTAELLKRNHRLNKETIIDKNAAE